MGKKRKLIYLLLPVLVILLAFAFYDYVYVAIQEERRSLDELTESKQLTLDKYVNAIAQKGALEQGINVLKERRKIEEDKMVEGQTPSVAAANLQNRVKVIVTGKGGSISSERVEKTEEMGRYKVVTVSMDTLLPETKALSDILALIDSSPVALTVRELDVRVRNMREPRELMVKFKISAMNVGK